MDQEFAPLDGVAVVTGGTGGLGRAICALLVERGARVAFTTRSAAKVDDVVGAVDPDRSGRIEGHEVDLADTDRLRSWVDGLVERHGTVHTLIHAAGPLVRQSHLSRVDPAEYRAQLDAEAGAFFTVVHALLPALRASHGSLVAVTTAAAAPCPRRTRCPGPPSPPPPAPTAAAGPGPTAAGCAAGAPRSGRRRRRPSAPWPRPP